MEHPPLTVNDILPCAIVATMFPALELWIIFVINGSFIASLIYWLVYGLAVSTSSFVLWYWLITPNDKKKAGRF